MRKLLFSVLAILVGLTGNAQLKFTYVNPANDQITIKNFGSAEVDITNYRLCALFEYSNLSQPGVSIVSGDFLLGAGEAVTIAWAASSGFNTTASDLGLYLPTGSFSLASNMVDFMQYGAGGQGRENVAASAGLWTAGSFLTGSGPWYYIGNGSASGLAQWSATANVNVTFRVDMSQQTVSANGVHVAGSFQFWNPSASLMNDDGNGIYSATFSVQPGTYQFKYINGNDWPQQESVPAACGVSDGFGGYNRNVVIPAGGPVVLDAVCFGTCAACNNQPGPVTVTLKVDMSEVTVSPEGVHVAGSFQGWNPGSSLMTDLGNGIYAYTFETTAGTQLLYKFINGITWGDSEAVPAECGIGDGFGGYNRELIAPENDLNLGAVCFSQCAACAGVVEPSLVQVNIRVDMSNETVDPNGVHILGSFQNWTSPGPVMSPIGNNVYEHIFEVAQNTSFTYKFVNGTDIANVELVPSACGTDDGFGGFNRTATVALNDTILQTDCFSACGACEIIQEPLQVNVTFQVNMQNEIVSADGVHLVGTFNDWDATASEMTDADGDGIYSITLAIDTNSTILYTFLNGNTYAGQETVPAECGTDNGFGGYNRSAEIAEADLILDAVCFSSCVDCEPIVEPLTVDVTFQVNMQNETVSADGVHLVGTFNDWDATASEMTDGDGDGIYSITLAIDTNSTILYTFLNGNSYAGQETVPAECGTDNGFGGYNRSADIAEADLVLDAVCFSSCIDCEPIVEPLTVDITFQVNMQNETVSADGVHLVGTFNDWDATASEMTDGDGDGIYSITLAIDTNSTILYTFLNGNTYAGQETVPAECGTDNGFGGYNRSADIAEADLVLDVVCFSSCVNCEPIVEPVFVNVTFQVNMANETVSANGVHIAGSFQGWNPATTALSDDDLDGIFSVTLPIEAGTSILYKFINGNTWLNTEIVPMSCGINDGSGNINRGIGLSTSDVVLDPVCFGECLNCGEVIPQVNITFLVNMQNETVSPDGVYVVGEFQNWNLMGSPMTDDDGDGIYSFTTTTDAVGNIFFKFVNGNAWANAELVPSECGEPDGFGGYNRLWQINGSDETFGPVCFGECTDCEPIVEPSTVQVTFRVNMQNETVSAEGVSIVGNFIGGNNAIHSMDDIDGDGVFELTLPVDTNALVLYAFVNGIDFTGEEIVPEACATLNDINLPRRSLTTGDSDIVLQPVCFSSCENCITANNNMITFMVNMMNETVSPDGVHVAGNFNNWDPAANPMTDDDGDGVYTATIETDEWANLSFKFINGNSFDGVEVVPSSCGLPDGLGGYARILETGTYDLTFGPVCFSECANCEGSVFMVDLTFLVDMTTVTVDPNGVHVAGNFQGWDPAGSEMTDSDADGIYEFTASVESGTAINFKFINGNTWGGSETVPAACGVDDGFGGFNRSYFASTLGGTYGPVCFSECVSCDNVVDPTLVNVTFQVNMQNSTVSPLGVHLAGNVQGWNPGSTEMTDDDGDGIYEVTLEVEANTTAFFKFINGNQWADSEIVPAACGVGDGFGAYNRSLAIAQSDTAFGPVCFGECEDCQPFTPVMVIFNVDMSNQTVGAEGVYVAGNFNNWDETATQLSDSDGDNIYEGVAFVNAGTLVAYKFLNGPDWGMVETVPAECGTSDGVGGFNRTYQVESSPVTLPVVCFSECSSCVVVPTVDVTFQVDMSQQSVSANGVHVAGSFNGFSPTATVLNETTPGVYTATVTVPQNTLITYKFINGNAFDGSEETVPFECGLEDGFGGYNRSVTTDDVDVVLPEVCFASCADCPISVDEVSVNDFVLYPNPANDFFILSSQNVIGEVQVFDSKGALIERQQVNRSGQIRMDASTWGAGIYRIYVPGIGSRNLLID